MASQATSPSRPSTRLRGGRRGVRDRDLRVREIRNTTRSRRCRPPPRASGGHQPPRPGGARRGPPGSSSGFPRAGHQANVHRRGRGEPRGRADRHGVLADAVSQVIDLRPARSSRRRPSGPGCGWTACSGWGGRGEVRAPSRHRQGALAEELASAVPTRRSRSLGRPIPTTGPVEAASWRHRPNGQRDRGREPSCWARRARPLRGPPPRGRKPRGGATPSGKLPDPAGDDDLHRLHVSRQPAPHRADKNPIHRKRVRGAARLRHPDRQPLRLLPSG